MSGATIVFAVPEGPNGDGAGSEQLRRVRAELQDIRLEVRWVRTVADARAALYTEAGVVGAVVHCSSPAAFVATVPTSANQTVQSQF